MVTVPNVIGNANIRFLANAYETMAIEEDDFGFDISIDANVDSSSIFVIGSIYPSFETDMRAEIIDPESCVVGTANFKSDMDGSYSCIFDLSGKLETGLYKIVVYVSNSEKTIEIPVVIPLAKVNVIEQDNPTLYKALVNAQEELDPERDGVINVSELESITGILDLGNSNIESINGLQACTGITELYLNDNKIVSLDAIASLDNLNKLVADNNNVCEVNMLPVSLEFINISRNNICNLQCIQFVNDLEYLFADKNNISNVDFAKGNSNLKYLSLNNNLLCDISKLINCRLLKYIDLSNNGITDISSLSALNYLQDLRISNNKVSNISMLPNVKYRNLYLDNNSISLSSISLFDAINKVYLPQKSN